MIETGPATLRNRLLSARCGDVALEPELAVQAIEQLEVAAGPDDGDLLYEGFLQGAICRLTQGKRAEAMAYLDKATELRPKRYEAYERRGRMLAEEAPRRAARILKRAYAMAPDAVRRSYATALWFAARDRDPDARRRAMIAQAEELLAQAIARDPDDGQSYSVRAWLRADAGRDAEAQADYKEALRAFNARKGFVGYLVMRARVSRTYYENSGSRLSSLRGSVARLLVASPWHALGATEAGIKEWIASKGTSPEGLQKAFDQLTRARQLNPLHWESALYLGRVLAAPWPGQDLKRAEAEARRAAELAPPN
jgi:tetratricopeptide (TPR) repeat protein